MTTQTIQIEVPNILLERAHVRALDEAQELITFLLENYIQELEKTQRRQVYEAYYAARTPEDEAEELELLADFAFADAEITKRQGCYQPVESLELEEMKPVTVYVEGEA